jgi:predicted nucleotidyltransferase
MTTRFGLSEATIQKLCAVLKQYPQVEQAVLYGSRATGTYRNGSDIDLALFGDDLNLQTLCKIMNAIDDLMLPHSVDLVIFGQVSDPDLRAHIQQAGVVFYQRKEPPPPDEATAVCNG